ncbi:MAG: T9SS type A sorting domain-containing protein [Paludibacter sp.]|nr:T9SS type A sorting domain-containing protein [Paludibacter sp.]
MKKWICLFFLSFLLSFLYAQDTLFFETCGKIEVTSSKKVDTYTGWDNPAPVTFTRTTTLDGYADIRATSSTTNHVWFPSGKSADLIISKIAVANYRDLKLSFDIAAYKLVEANVNKLTLTCNNRALALPSTPFSSTKFIAVTDIPIPDCDSITLVFEYTAANNTNGYRLDNFTITGEKAFTDIKVSQVNNYSPVFFGDNLIFPNATTSAPVTIFNSMGTVILSSRLNQGTLKLNGQLSKGFYFVRVGEYTWKILL